MRLKNIKSFAQAIQVISGEADVRTEVFLKFSAPILKNMWSQAKAI